MAQNKRRVTISLNFEADVRKAKKQIQDLQNSLTSVIQNTYNPDNYIYDKQLQEAGKAAQSLQSHLQAAVNVNTGKLDLSKFTASIKSSKQDLNTLFIQLQNGGQIGREAFAQLTRSIAEAEIPVKKTSKLVSQMSTTLANTVRWQASTAVINTLVGGIQSAYNYAEDLNESLNNIRIVTGDSANKMAVFAKEANNAAKELSTTTVKYADAALIFYQQGALDFS